VTNPYPSRPAPTAAAQTEPLTEEMVEALRTEAAGAGDRALVASCDRALVAWRGSETEQRRVNAQLWCSECARVINDARAQDDEADFVRVVP
jgi:hypothetical protein